MNVPAKAEKARHTNSATDLDPSTSVQESGYPGRGPRERGQTKGAALMDAASRSEWQKLSYPNVYPRHDGYAPSANAEPVDENDLCAVHCGPERMPEDCGKRTGSYPCPAERPAKAAR